MIFRRTPTKETEKRSMYEGIVKKDSMGIPIKI